MTNLRGFGTRLGVLPVTNGEDVWEGTASTIPTPADVGEQMTLVSTSIEDTSPGGTGARSVLINYLDNNGVPQSETVTMNGIIEVDTTAINIRFVQEICATEVGSNGTTVGTISIYKKGFPTTVYNIMSPGNNDSMNTARMVPANNILVIRGFTATGTNSTTVTDLRLMSTSLDGVLTPGIFHVIDNGVISNSTIFREFFSSQNIPALAIVKATAYTSAPGQDCQASWDGYTIFENSNI